MWWVRFYHRGPTRTPSPHSTLRRQQQPRYGIHSKAIYDLQVAPPHSPHKTPVTTRESHGYSYNKQHFAAKVGGQTHAETRPADRSRPPGAARATGSNRKRTQHAVTCGTFRIQTMHGQGTLRRPHSRPHPNPLQLEADPPRGCPYGHACTYTYMHVRRCQPHRYLCGCSAPGSGIMIPGQDSLEMYVHAYASTRGAPCQLPHESRQDQPVITLQR